MADTTGSGQGSGGLGSGTQPPEPEGRFAGIPYDWRVPTAEKLKARWWNRDDRRLLTPKAFGWGYDLNLYWVTHPLDYLKNQQDQ